MLDYKKQHIKIITKQDVELQLFVIELTGS